MHDASIGRTGDQSCLQYKLRNNISNWPLWKISSKFIATASIYCRLPKGPRLLGVWGCDTTTKLHLRVMRQTFTALGHMSYRNSLQPLEFGYVLGKIIIDCGRWLFIIDTFKRKLQFRSANLNSATCFLIELSAKLLTAGRDTRHTRVFLR